MDQRALMCLDLSTRSRFRSASAIPSFSQCAEELVCNSIDAGAGQIVCEYDTRRLCCKVTDNGRGFAEEDLMNAGSRYFTSKCGSLQDIDRNLLYYGYRGEALASIAQLSKDMEILSQRHDMGVISKKTIHSEKHTISKTKAPNSVAKTSVSFRGLFHRLPVRRLGLNLVLEAQNTVEKIMRISVAHPAIAFTVVNTSSSTLDFSVHEQENCLKRFARVFCDSDPARSIKPINPAQNASNRFLIEGGISTRGHENKSMQLVFVNKRPVLKSKIQSEINSLLTKSSIARDTVHAYDREQAKSASSRTFQKTYGIYYVNIRCAYDEYDISFEPEKTHVEFRDWAVLLRCISTTVRKFLKDNDIVTYAKGGNQTMLEKPKMIESVTGQVLHPNSCVIGGMAHSSNLNVGKAVGGSGEARKTTVEKFIKENTPAKCKRRSRWIPVFDKSTGRSIYVDFSTGMTSNSDPCQAEGQFQSFSTTETKIGPRYVKEFLPRSKKQREVGFGSSRRIEVSNKEWKNPAVPIKANELKKIESQRVLSSFKSSVDSIVFTKDMFASLKAIGQVDGKFIVCSLVNCHEYYESKQNSLIIFDQHAAHERIRLELLERRLREEGKIDSEILEKKLTIRLKEGDAKIVCTIKDTFASNGLRFNEGRSETGVLEVTALPRVFLDRVSKMADNDKRALELQLLTLRFLRDEIQVYKDTGRGSSVIPSTLFEILCSQACHGAIRFGDALDVGECKKIVKQLSACQLPFQCAHGRPSLTSIRYDRPEMETSKPNLRRIKLLNSTKSTR